MKIDLNMEIGGKKKAVYPSKKTINLYQQESTSTRMSTIILDIIFVVVVVIGLAKLLVVDVLVERNEALAKAESLQAQLDQQMVALEDYNEINEEYVRYSYKVLVDAQGLQDRLVILEMLENTVFEDSNITNVTISGNAVSLSFSGFDLNKTAQLLQEIESYDIVSSVKVNNQSGNTADGTYSGSMVITLNTPGGN